MTNFGVKFFSSLPLATVAVHAAALLVAPAMPVCAQGWQNLPEPPALSSVQPSTIVLANDGSSLYCAGYTATNSIVFRYNPTTQQYGLLYTFHGTSDGSRAMGLVQARDGMLYGVAYPGSSTAAKFGTFFSLDPAVGSSSFNVRYLFDASNSLDTRLLSLQISQGIGSDTNIYVPNPTANGIIPISTSGVPGSLIPFAPYDITPGITVGPGPTLLLSAGTNLDQYDPSTGLSTIDTSFLAPSLDDINSICPTGTGPKDVAYISAGNAYASNSGQILKYTPGNLASPGTVAPYYVFPNSGSIAGPGSMILTGGRPGTSVGVLYAVMGADNSNILGTYPAVVSLPAGASSPVATTLLEDASYNAPSPPPAGSLNSFDYIDPNATLLYQAANGDLVGYSPANSRFFSIDPLARPATVHAVTTGGAIGLTWAPVAAATGYSIFRASVSGGELNVASGNYTMPAGSSEFAVSGGSTSAFTDTSTLPGEYYYYLVAASNAGGNGPLSPEVSNIIPLATPTGVMATSTTTTEIALSWTAVPGATGYNVYRGTAKGGEGARPVNKSPVSSPAFTDSGLLPNTAYYYTVIAVDGSGGAGVSRPSSELMQGTDLFEFAAAGLQMIASPTSGQPASLFKDPTIGLASWDAAQTRYDIPVRSVVPGAGYWANLKKPTAMPYNSALASPPVSVGLSTGWNLIGDPFLTAEPAGSIDITLPGQPPRPLLTASQDRYIAMVAYTWQPGDSIYETESGATLSLNPFQGYWVYALQPCTVTFK